jgi:hypothetical protein
MRLKNIIGGLFVAILFFFGIIFALASSYATTRLIIAALFFIVGFGLLYYLTRKPKVTIQKLELSGQMKAVALQCPNCSASIKSDQIKVVSGVPYAKCVYCDHTFEVAEDPKW